MPVLFLWKKNVTLPVTKDKQIKFQKMLFELMSKFLPTYINRKTISMGSQFPACLQKTKNRCDQHDASGY